MGEHPHGTVVFFTHSLPQSGFDVFSLAVHGGDVDPSSEIRHTDGVSANFNGSFVSDDDKDTGGNTVVFVSERTGYAKLFLAKSEIEPPEPVCAAEGSLFHDRPVAKNGRLYFVSAHEPPDEPYRSWCAVYSTELANAGEAAVVQRVTPPGVVDFSPAVSQSGKMIAVASYGLGPWKGDFRVLETEVVVFRSDDTNRRVTVADRSAGWPSWCGDSTVFFHRVADDGWWSVFCVDVTDNLDWSAAHRVTPPGVHSFTPAISPDGRWLAVATRRKGRAHRHVELFDVKNERFLPATETVNPDVHHYNPFFSPAGARLGYHRFRGEGGAYAGDDIVPHLQPVVSPEPALRMLRVHGTFPSFSPNGQFIAINGDFFVPPGLMILRSDGSKRWTVIKEPAVFGTAWSPTEREVIFVAMGPIFETFRSTVRIARVTVDVDGLRDDVDDVSEHVTVKMLSRAEAGNDAFPSCSPDGRQLVFRSGRSGHKNLYIMDAVRGEENGGEGLIRRLTDGEWIDTMPAWSPEGDVIAFSSNRHDPSNPNVFSIYLVRPDGSDLRRVGVAGSVGSEAANRERINHVCFSPDGRWLLFNSNFGSVMAEPVSAPNQYQPYGDLYACRLDGSGLVRLTCNAYENGLPAWAPPGVPAALLARPSFAGVKLRGQFDEPLWLTCDV